MKVLTTIAAVALAAGLSAAQAQSPGTPGQDQRGQFSTATGMPRSQDAPPSEMGTGGKSMKHASRHRTHHARRHASSRTSHPGETSTTGAGGMSAPREPTNSLDRSVGDRNSRGTTKNAPGGQ